MKTDVAHRLIWLNGAVIPVNEAMIPVMSPTSQFGLNVFEGIPGYWNETEKQLYVFRLDAHLDRLQRSARMLEIDLPYSREEMKQAILDTVRANEYDTDLSIRQTVFVQGSGSWGSEGPSGMFVAPIPRRNTSAEYNKKGLNVCVSSWRRIADTTLSPHIKCGANYINSRMAQREALRNSYDTCLFLNDNGKLAEGPGSCLFVVRGGKLLTPQLSDGVLESITRDTVITLAERLGIPFESRSMDRTEMYIAEEAFLCGSAMELTPILSVDRQTVGSGEPGPVTRKLHSAYVAAARGETDDLRGWITPVYEKESII